MFSNKMNSKTKSFFSGDNVIMIIILIVAAILRLYNFNQIPYTFDEISALDRTAYNSFSELITKGVMIDGHPGGIQIFLSYWTHFFGYLELTVKFPFIVAGLASVWLVFVIGKKWFNSTTGILSAAFIASIQFTVMYSQIARPYASGLFFFLLFIYFWTIIVVEKRDKRFYWFGFSFTAALCAYNHYFSLFAAVIAALTGMLLVTSTLRKKYFLYSGLAILLFLPHIFISIHQVSKGGLNWLPTPDSSFFSMFGGFILHHSWWLIVFFIGLILTGIILYIRSDNRNKTQKLRWIGLVWFLLPLISGFIYSIYGKPVLQVSVLIFSVPFLFITVFSFFPPLKTKLNTVLFLLVFCFTIPTLIFSRQYYKFFFNQGYDGIAEHQIALLDSLKQPVSLLINGYDPLYLQYYSFKYKHEIPCVLYSFDNYNTEQFSRYLKNIKTNYIAVALVGGAPLHYFDLTQNEFPYFVKRAVGLSYEWYVFSKAPPSNPSQYLLEVNNSFDNPQSVWNCNQTNIIKDPSDSLNLIYQFKSGEEWGPTFKTTVSELKCSRHDVIHFSVNILPDSLCDASLVISMNDSNDSTIYWNSVPQSDFYGIPKHWKKMNMVIRLTDVKIPKDSVFINAYIWNRSKSILFLDDFNVKVEKGNPFIYAIFVDF